MIELKIGGTTKRSKFTPKQVTIDWENLPEPSRAFVIAYGLRQYLADGTAGAESQADFDSGVDDRMKNLANGDFTRKRGEADAKPDTPEGRALRNIKQMIRDKLKAANKTATKEQVADAAKKVLGSDAGKPFLAEARKQLEAEKKLAENVMEGINADVMKELGIEL